MYSEEVDMRRPAGILKTWRQCVEEHMRRMNISDERVYECQEWEGLIHRPTP